ncbi:MULTISPECIES: restriction endonuclease subunit S [unclassified Paenibacillus]|uniref:restriction endonuclease subunit S n=1 Tax=unclassified Paenibacillus TaxID=185978 RepID=UPI00048A486C|nr:MULTISPECIES: restriction endonuclease subunit S [unclassified Paenibacillus]SFR25567.1 type I restriction enzyme, S subunit [Paenibacillus sp. cl130]
MIKPNFIEELLDGVQVEWKTLGEIGEFTRGKRFVKTDMLSEGFPCIHYGEMYTHYNIWADKTKSFVSHDLASKLRVAEHGDVIIVAAGETIEDIGIGTAWLGPTGVVIHDACFAYRSSLNPKYVSYFLRTKHFHDQIKKYISSGKISAINANGLSKAQIPIPPLKVQEEIVRILDILTELTAELTVELTVELTARKKQYTYYRDKLLSFDEDEVEWKALGEVAEKIYSGGTPKTGVTEYWENGTIPWMSSGEVNLETVYATEKYITKSGLENSSAKFVPKNSIVIALAGQGKTRGKVARIRIDLTTNQSLAALTFDESKVNTDYIFHYLKTQYDNLRQISSGSGTRGGLNLQMISNYKIPIPTTSEQARIVSILDKFDALTSSITEDLPREIELRQKQFEYYRNMLLSFPKEEVEA